jgi:hypothetical protein
MGRGISQLILTFVCEKGHRPVEHGTLEYDTLLARWTRPHSDSRIQKLAECYMESYMGRTIRCASADLSSSASQ